MKRRAGKDDAFEDGRIARLGQGMQRNETSHRMGDNGSSLSFAICTLTPCCALGFELFEPSQKFGRGEGEGPTPVVTVVHELERSDGMWGWWQGRVVEGRLSGRERLQLVPAKRWRGQQQFREPRREDTDFNRLPKSMGPTCMSCRPGTIVSVDLSSSSSSSPIAKSTLRMRKPTFMGIHIRLLVLASRRMEPL